MKQKPVEKAQGLFLSEPALLTRKVSFFSFFFFYFPLLLLGGCSALFCFYTAFSLPVSLSRLFLCNLLFSALSALLFLQKKHRALYTLCLPLLLLAGSLIFASQLRAGLFYTVNRVISAYMERSGLTLPALPLEILDRKEILFSSALFTFALTLILQWALSWALIRKNSGFLAFAFSGILLLVPMVFSIEPPPFALAMILIFWGSLLLLRPVLTGEKGLIKTRRSFHISGALAARAAALPVLLLVSLFLVFASHTASEEHYSRPRVMDDIRSGVFHGAQFPVPERTKGIGKNNTSVDLKELGDRNYTGKTMLRVKTSKPASDYLKGFCGSVYTGESWEQRSEEQNAAAKAALGSEKAQFLNARLLFQLPMAEEDSVRYSLTVRNVGANPRCAYLPYTMTESGLSSILEPVEDGFFQTKNRIFGESEYTVSALWSWEMENPFSWQIPFHQSESDFLSSLIGYSKFVNKTDTQLPEQLKEPLESYLSDRGLLLSHHGSPRQLIKAIVEAVHSQCTYTLSPGVCPQGEDFVLYFLLTGKKGYCVHFATAAALLFRAAGIPARYAEGYVAPPAGEEAEWIDLPDHSAHAWVEVYFQNCGWVPVEVTPGLDFSQTSQPPDHTEFSPSPSPSSPEDPRAEDPSPTVSPETVTPTPESSRPPVGGITSPEPSQPGETAQIAEAPHWPLFLFLFLFGILCLSGLLVLRRRRLLSRREKAFSSKNRNEAALSYYARILALQNYLPFEGPPPLSEALEDLARKARFSQHTLTPQELSLFENRLNAHIAFLEKTVSPLERWCCRYLRVLF